MHDAPPLTHVDLFAGIGPRLGALGNAIVPQVAELLGWQLRELVEQGRRLMAELVPVTLGDARRFVAEHHRHNVAPRGWLFGVGIASGGELAGVAIAGRPNARGLQDGRTVEVTRVCHLGSRNAGSRLYGAVCRAAAALGWRRVVTYTLASESGASLRAAGFRPVAEVKAGRSWASSSGKGHGGRYDRTLFGQAILPDEDRVRWERSL